MNNLQARHLFCFSFFGFFMVSLSVSGQNEEIPQQPDEDRKRIEALRISSKEDFKLDGWLVETFWNEADTAHGFLQQEPNVGMPATERSVVRIAYDSSRLLIGAILYDEAPREIKAFQRRWDSELETDDNFSFILDTYDNQRSAYYFRTNPEGMMGDGLLRVGQGVDLNMAWDGIWEVAVNKGSYGWSVEIEIPFRTLNFDPDNHQWGINFKREVRRKNEESLWNGSRRNQSIKRPQDAGLLTGLEDISQGVGLEFNPYGITQYNYSSGKGSNWKATGGGDLNYSLTPNMRAGLTFNTDFAETEVDDRRVNLTRFPLVFPEKRDFFLEGGDVFEFAPTSGNVTPYFSRRIGLVNREPIPILGGGRLIGRVEKNDVGFYQIRTAGHDSIPAEDFTVARVVRSIFDESSIGIMYTRRSSQHSEHREPYTLQDRHSLGMDLNLNTSSFLNNKNFQFEAFFVNHNPHIVDDTTEFWDRTARGIRFNYPNPPWTAKMSYRELGNAYDPAVGFVPRNSFRRLQPDVTFSPLIEGSNLIRELNFKWREEFLMDLQFRPATFEHRITFFGLRLESGDEISMDVSNNYEWLKEDFDIMRDGDYIIPAGEYSTWEYTLEASTASYRRISGTVEFTKEGFWTGNRNLTQVGVTLRPYIGVNIKGDWIYNDVNLAEGAFDTHVFRLRSGVDLSPWVSFNLNLQYDNLTERVGMNNRFRWIIQPGSDLYLVYNQNWMRRNDILYTLESQATLKLTYTHRF